MTWVLKISANNRFPGQATSLSSHIRTANKIVKEKLTSSQLDLFKRTVFGRFVDMDLIFNSPLVHYILLREAKDKRSDAMGFDLNDISSPSRMTSSRWWQDCGSHLPNWFRGKRLNHYGRSISEMSWWWTCTPLTLRKYARTWTSTMTWTQWKLHWFITRSWQWWGKTRQRVLFTNHFWTMLRTWNTTTVSIGDIYYGRGHWRAFRMH